MLDTIAVFVLVGFTAQMIDGALGMLYGITSTAVLLSIGIPPAAASASVHTAEIFTSGLSGVAHMRFGNVDQALFRRLIFPGVAGGMLGAYMLASTPGREITAFVALYLMAMGLMVLSRALKRVPETIVSTRLYPLGLAGGFLDAIGGGGWGPIVTSTLVARGHKPRYAIGSANLAEFFVTAAEAATFFALMGLGHLPVILGLIIGGALAAPIAAIACKRLPSRALMGMVGALVVLLSARTIYLALI